MNSNRRSLMKVLFTIVGDPKGACYLFYREVNWPDNAPIPRISENVMIGTLFPCRVEKIFWAVDGPRNNSKNEPFLTIFCHFEDSPSLLFEADSTGFLQQNHPYFPKDL